MGLMQQNMVIFLYHNISYKQKPKAFWQKSIKQVTKN